jgi:NADH:ubiquinone reductase (H+-translocating)
VGEAFGQKRWLMAAHKVLILGGGFAGLSAVQHLRDPRIDVTLVDRRNFHLFQPLMYQVATGSLCPGEIAAPLRSVLSKQRNVRVWLGEAVDLDPDRSTVTLKDKAIVPYDSLIVATGADTSYFGKDSWREFAPSPKSVEEAIAIRHKIFYAFEAAERATDPQEISKWLTFVIVGAGATGLELAGALAEIARQTLRHDFRSIRPQEARIILMEAAPRVLPGYPQDLSASAQRLIERLGVEVQTSTLVSNIDDDSVTFVRDGQTHRLETMTVLWGGGITATEFGRTVAARTHAQTDKAGRIKVTPDLSITGYPNIFVVGDLALALDRSGKPIPGVAQLAIQQGAYAARAIRCRLADPQKTLTPFVYHDIGEMAVIGRAAAVANVLGIHISGWPAWLVWLFVHLMNLVEFQSRILVFIQWAFEYLTFSRGSRLITGDAQTPDAGASRR